jgi:hypothetical protein
VEDLLQLLVSKEYIMIIGLCGFIGAGKGTVGVILRDGYGYSEDSFARPLKDAVATIFGWDRRMLEGDTHDSRQWREKPSEFWSKHFGYTFTPRLALQLMGTEAGRNVFHPDLWVISLLARNQNKNVIITDVRFKNEVTAVRNAGGLIVRVRRGIDPLWYSTALLANGGNKEALERMQEAGIHPSEWDWIGAPIDHILENDGTLNDLKGKIANLFQTHHCPLTSASK